MLKNIIKKALFYVSSARYEGLPMTMIEAQSFGLPVISMDFDTGPRDIISNGTDGYIITGKDMRTVKNLFSKKILELLNDKEKLKLLNKNALKAARRFSEEEIIKKWVHILEEL